MKTITDTAKYLINDNTSTYDYVTEAIFIMIVLLREQNKAAATYLLRDNTGEITVKREKSERDHKSSDTCCGIINPEELFISEESRKQLIEILKSTILAQFEAKKQL